MGLQRGQGWWSPAALPATGHQEAQLPCLCHCQPPAELSRVSSCSEACCRGRRCLLSSLSAWGKGLLACRDLPQLQGAVSASPFFAFLLAAWLREVLPASERLPGCAQPRAAAAKSSLLRIPGGMEGMEPSSSAQLCCLLAGAGRAVPCQTEGLCHKQLVRALAAL